MDYGMIGQIAKAKHYAEERHRIRFLSFVVAFEGSNNPHMVTFDGQNWESDSQFFQQHGWSSHTVALERILHEMVTPIDTANNGKTPAPQSSVIGQIEKAGRYAEEPQRVRFLKFQVEFTGENHTHAVVYDEGKWSCTCHFFETHAWCSHSIAIERILAQMVTPGAPQVQN